MYLTNTIKEGIPNTLRNIYNHLEKHHTQYAKIGALNGLAGIALFQFYYEKYFNKKTNNGYQTLELCNQKINEGYNIPTYCDGIAGFGWFLQHLHENNFVKKNIFDQNLNIIDSYIEKSIYKSIDEDKYDFFHGCLGYIFYFARRTEKINIQKIENLFSLFISKLPHIYNDICNYNLSKFYEKEIIETTEIRRVHTGIAHGISSIIAILNLLYKKDIYKEQSEKWVNHFTTLLFELKMPENSISKFPIWLDLASKEKHFSSLSWCSGDIGIGLTLLNISKSLHAKSLYNNSIEVLVHSSKRRGIEQSFIRNYGICHGYFGASRIFSRASEISNEEVLKDASTFWFEKGVNYLEINQDSSLSILNGLAGAGLVMIDAYFNQLNNWDECLLLS